MIKTIFKIGLIALAIAVLGVSCKDYGTKNEKSTPETNTEAIAPAKGTDLKNVNESNWQAVTKANFGVDLPVPAGWVLKEVNSPNGVNNLVITMTANGGTTGKEEGRRLFAATQAISKHGNYKANANWEAETVSAGGVINDFSAADAFKDNDVSASWAFTFNSKMIMVNYYFVEDAKHAEYTFTINRTIN